MRSITSSVPFIRFFLGTLALVFLFEVFFTRPAVSGLIAFDDFSPPSGFGFASADRYRNSGVVFDRAIPIENVSAVEPGFFPAFLAQGGTTPNALALTVAFAGAGLSIDVLFVEPGTSMPTTTDFFQARFFDTEVGSLLGKLEAFDSNGILIASASVSTPSSMSALLQINTPGTARVRLSTDGDGTDIDNFVFNVASVPEPTTIVLFVIGLAVLARVLFIEKLWKPRY
jgi:hypothetical protein